jgi:hypothetical protein
MSRTALAGAVSASDGLLKVDAAVRPLPSVWLPIDPLEGGLAGPGADRARDLPPGLEPRGRTFPLPVRDVCARPPAREPLG